ncbi:Imm8 family immunity protein [Streptosporangium sp. G11]|uniref:Imm8 family immunity protein n=1 Tax=Streptosporangium sp. G11 TaxID=3436926 RepID=UPI003EB90EE4
MRAEVKGFHSPDLDWLSEFPEDPNDFGILLQVFVGPASKEGSESFDIMICTPSFVARRIAESGIVDGRHHLLVSHFKKDDIEFYITKRVNAIDEPSWVEVANKLSRLGRWEFEDYDD